jgi:hypothetical protein
MDTGKIEHKNYFAECKINPQFSTEVENGHSIVTIGDKNFKMDHKDRDTIANFRGKFGYVHRGDVYPICIVDGVGKSLLELLNKKKKDLALRFKNDDIFDIRTSNIEYMERCGKCCQTYIAHTGLGTNVHVMSGGSYGLAFSN